MKFEVTEKAMRPASPKRQCFYCQSPIGDYHKSGCVLINKIAKVRMIVDYEVDVPFDWDKSMIEFHRNDGTWCSSNAITELQELEKKLGCLCQIMKFECIEDQGEAFLDE